LWASVDQLFRGIKIVLLHGLIFETSIWPLAGWALLFSCKS